MRFAVGVTGSIGSGKSSFARLLCDALTEGGYVATLLDADRVARDLVETDPKAPVIRRQLAARFGEDILMTDGELDRKVLAQRGFADDRSASDLNTILHPHVRAAFAARLAGDGVFVLDVPLLFESGMNSLCDATVTVTAPRALRHARAARFADVSDRERRQWPEEKKAMASDLVVNNDGSLEQLADLARSTARKLLPASS